VLVLIGWFISQVSEDVGKRLSKDTADWIYAQLHDFGPKRKYRKRYLQLAN
jgi:hypothetical protein